MSDLAQSVIGKTLRVKKNAQSPSHRIRVALDFSKLDRGQLEQIASRTCSPTINAQAMLRRKSEHELAELASTGEEVVIEVGINSKKIGPTFADVKRMIASGKLTDEQREALLAELG